ncbi:MAG: hypothetical protein QW416_04245 [Candidatus Nitrosocaldaceae archaeon]
MMLVFNMEYSWHMLFAKEMIEIAKRSKSKTAAYALLVAFEHIIDAYIARGGKHFHEEYLADAWKKRIEWMREHDILDRFDMLTCYCSKVIEGKEEYVYDMLTLIENMVIMD